MRTRARTPMRWKNTDSNDPVDAPVHRMSRYGYYGLIVLILLLFAFIRFRLRDFPLERDEGEYAYMGQLILQGIPPYKLAYSMKLPGTYAAYAVILAIFGQTPAAIHCGLIVINAVTVLLVYLLGTRLFSRLSGIVGCACYALLSTGQTVLGTAAHATHFVLLHALAGILLLTYAMERRRNWLLFLSGILLGLAFLMKQSGIVFGLFAGAYWIICELRKRPVDWKGLVSRACVFLMGAMAPLALTCLILFAYGVFNRFWFWTFSYAREYASEMGISQGLQRFMAEFPRVAAPSMLIWLSAAFGLTAIFWDHRARDRAGFVIGFALSSFLAVCLGFYFRPHYFILLLPAVALSAGLAVSAASRYLYERAAFLRMLPVLLLVLAYAYSIFQQRSFFFQTDPVTACRQAYGTSPFPESLEIARYLDAHAPKDARIAVLGSEPQIYFYSGRRSATGYLYTYGLMETQAYAMKMQEEMIDEIEKARPEYLVYVRIPTSWTAGPNSEKRIFAWADRYTADRYLLDGIVEVRDSGESEYHWGDEAKSYHPHSDLTLSILRRK